MAALRAIASVASSPENGFEGGRSIRSGFAMLCRSDSWLCVPSPARVACCPWPNGTEREAVGVRGLASGGAGEDARSGVVPRVEKEESKEKPDCESVGSEGWLGGLIVNGIRTEVEGFGA